jgi:ATP-dependent protease ClpP protease subunit
MAEAHLGLLRRYHECLARFTGHAVAEVEVWCAEGRFFGAGEAKEAGLIDEISRGKTALRPLR